MRKGELTRAAIVATALEMSARAGLEGLTIGALAERMRMSKSGVFAHFGSREDLQIAVLKAYERRFVDDILVPALKEKRGLLRRTNRAASLKPPRPGGGVVDKRASRKNSTTVRKSRAHEER